MSKQLSITTDRRILTDGNYLWGNPRQFGSSYVDDTGETIFTGTLFGRSSFANENELKTREFLKGGSVIFTFSFQDITPLVNGSALPSPEVVPAEIKYPPKDLNRGSCASSTSTPKPHQTTNESSFITHDPMMETTDYRTTNDSFTTLPTPKTTNESSFITHDPPETTDYSFTTLPTPKTTNESSFITHDPPETTDYSTTTSDPQMTTDYSTTPLRANKNHG
ncbi:hypothetical protein PBY51_017327 [Eleginops maclovinus]|uniref:Uncharacterized protein n=1 Tax=Eleginops maclovinus TaxID=56733 RepID=A0AAN7XCP8_ELEMC|nr:hypothetical protein PBY51_017327 [Eleginops maclovinus]